MVKSPPAGNQNAAAGRRRFLWLALLALSSCGQWNPVILGNATNSAPTNLANYVIRAFQTDYMAMSIRRWHLVADEASFFERDNIVNVSNVTMETFTEQGQVINRVACEFGTLSNATRNIVLSNRVVMVTSNGTVVRGQYFIWDNALEQFTSPTWVLVTKPDGVKISGWGFVADRRIDTYTFFNSSGELPGSNARF